MDNKITPFNGTIEQHKNEDSPKLSLPKEVLIIQRRIQEERSKLAEKNANDYCNSLRCYQATNMGHVNELVRKIS